MTAPYLFLLTHYTDNPLETFLKNIIIQAGDICKKEQKLLKPSDVDFKGKKDLVTTIDKQVEDFIVTNILKKYPSHGILGEET
ncbi:MAG: hypothetical protein GY857_11850, partial [Desulfobacula sp.]|nr:hypothetical protein [Desulfobacula sp.]